MAKIYHPDAFKGRVYGVTGAAYGIGEETANALLNLGARVVVIDRDKDQIDRAREKWRGFGKSVVLRQGDGRW